MTADVIQLADHRRKWAAITVDELDELRMDNQVLRAEKATFAAHARQYNRAAQLALYQAQPDADAAIRWLSTFDQITERELARVRALAVSDAAQADAVRQAA